MNWLLRADIQEMITNATMADVPHDFAISAGKGILDLSGDVARIRVNGILTPKPDRFAAFFGGANTSYDEIISAIDAANERNPKGGIVMEIGSSPGGNMEGLIPAMDAVRSSPIPIRAEVVDSAHSAAYGLASQAKGGLYAAHRATMFGSVGVVTSRNVKSSFVDITNEESPNKRPDATTEDGKKAIQEELGKVFGIFADTIAMGRGTTKEMVVKSFGRGASFPAGVALEAGMIDGVKSTSGEKSSAGKTEVVNMTLEELKKEHRALYDEIVNGAVAQERTRVSAHLVLGDASGDMARAIADVKGGTEVTQETSAFHMAASIKESRKQNLLADNKDADLGSTPAPKADKTPEQIQDEAIAAAMDTWTDPDQEVING